MVCGAGGPCRTRHGRPDRRTTCRSIPISNGRTPTGSARFWARLGANHGGFHHISGAAYRFYADWLLQLDAVNPQTTARMSTAFETWTRYDGDRKALIRAELERIAAAPNLSRGHVRDGDEDSCGRCVRRPSSPGPSDGIGQECARQMARAGWDVAVHYHHNLAGAGNDGARRDRSGGAGTDTSGRPVGPDECRAPDGGLFQRLRPA